MQKETGDMQSYVRMMWMILQAEKPDDWVIATGTTTSVRDFIKIAFKFVGVELEFIGKGDSEKGIIKKSVNKQYSFIEGKEVIIVDPKYFRPTEVDILVGDSSKAKRELGWEPKITLNELVNEMMEHDLKKSKKNFELMRLGLQSKK